jgi:hypothetical protein
MGRSTVVTSARVRFPLRGLRRFDEGRAVDSLRGSCAPVFICFAKLKSSFQASKIADAFCAGRSIGNKNS